jgi:hypothetical protein
VAVSSARHYFSHPQSEHSSSSGAGPPTTSMSVWATGPRRTPCIVLYFVGAFVTHLSARDYSIVPAAAFLLLAEAALVLGLVS